MNKWTALAAILLAAFLGGLYWFFTQQRQEVTQTSAGTPTETESPTEEFDTESELADTEGLLEGSDGPSAELPPEAGVGSPAPGVTPGTTTSGVATQIETIEDPDEGGETLEDPIVLDDNDPPQKPGRASGP